MKKILFILPFLLVGCSYSGSNNTSTNTTLPPQPATTISTGQTTNGTGIVVTQSGSTGATTSKIIFEKDLSPSVHLVQNEENVTIFFYGKKVTSTNNASDLNNEMLSEMAGPELNIPLERSNNGELILTKEQRKELERSSAKNTFFIRNDTDYAHRAHVTLLETRGYDFPGPTWILDEQTHDIIPVPDLHWIRGLVRTSSGILALVNISGLAERGEDRLELYSTSEIKNLPLLKTLAENEGYKKIESVDNKHIRVFYGKLDDYTNSGKENSTNWKSYVISL